MMLNIGKVLEQGASCRQYIDDKSSPFEAMLEPVVVCPALHRPDGAGVWGKGDVAD
jgi:hypothetical protein